jgi:hypothetical protein
MSFLVFLNSCLSSILNDIFYFSENMALFFSLSAVALYFSLIQCASFKLAILKVMRTPDYLLTFKIEVIKCVLNEVK